MIEHKKARTAAPLSPRQARQALLKIRRSVRNLKLVTVTERLDPELGSEDGAMSQGRTVAAAVAGTTDRGDGEGTKDEDHSHRRQYFSVHSYKWDPR